MNNKSLNVREDRQQAQPTININQRPVAQLHEKQR